MAAMFPESVAAFTHQTQHDDRENEAPHGTTTILREARR